VLASSTSNQECLSYYRRQSQKIKIYLQSKARHHFTDKQERLDNQLRNRYNKLMRNYEVQTVSRKHKRQWMDDIKQWMGRVHTTEDDRE